MQNFRALGAPPPDPRASGDCGLCPQTPRPPKQPPHCEFLATRLFTIMESLNDLAATSSQSVIIILFG